MIHIDLIRQDTRYPDKRRRHQGRASCEVEWTRKVAQPAEIARAIEGFERPGETRGLDGGAGSLEQTRLPRIPC